MTMANNKENNFDFHEKRDELGKVIHQSFEDKIIGALNQILRTSEAYSRYTVDTSYLYISNQGNSMDFGLLYKVVENDEMKIYDSRSLRNAINNGEVITRVGRFSGRTSTSEKELREKFGNTTVETKKNAFGATNPLITPKNSPLPLIEIDEEREIALYEFVAKDIKNGIVRYFDQAYKSIPAQIFASFDSNEQKLSMEFFYNIKEHALMGYNNSEVQSVLEQWNKCILSGSEKYFEDIDRIMPINDFMVKPDGVSLDFHVG